MKICIIPARGGSRRIKNKNFKKFNGIPIIVQTLKNLKKTNFFDKIIVSTDHKKIKDLSKKNGADLIIHREKYLLKDNIGTKEIVSNTIRKINLNIKDDLYIYCLYPTSVFVKKKHLYNALNLVKKKGCDTVFSAMRYSHPIQRSFQYSNNKLKFNYFHNMKQQTQKFNLNYHDAGQFYLAKINQWLNNQGILTKRSKFIEFFSYECTDIDKIEDWKLSEIIFKKNKNKI